VLLDFLDVTLDVGSVPRDDCLNCTRP
jgi:hypothetical protein